MSTELIIGNYDLNSYLLRENVVGHTPLKEPPFISHKNGLELIIVDDVKHKYQYELVI